MTRNTSPTDSELAILDVLWSRGPSTVREVQRRISDEREMGYTTALKLLQIMHAKGLVARDESARAHVYRARVDRDRTQRHLVRDLVRRGFGGSAHDLVLRVLETSASSPEDLDRIRRLLDRFDGDEDR